MKYPYIVIFVKFNTPENEQEFTEVMTSNFVSKRIHNNIFAFKKEKGTKPADVFNLIETKLSFKTNIMILKLSDFYGTFSNNGIGWIKENFSEISWIG